jgi:hypothetical protein
MGPHASRKQERLCWRDPEGLCWTRLLLRMRVVVNVCPLESAPPTLAVTPLLSSKGWPYFKTHTDLGKKHVAETKIDCAGEVQQQFSGPRLFPPHT